jgi:hypothetical protein
MANCATTGDETTWSGAAGAHRLAAEDPLQRHTCLDERPELLEQQPGRERLTSSQGDPVNVHTLWSNEICQLFKYEIRSIQNLTKNRLTVFIRPRKHSYSVVWWKLSTYFLLNFEWNGFHIWTAFRFHQIFEWNKFSNLKSFQIWIDFQIWTYF